MKTEATQTIQADWDGPYSWPGFESENKLQSLPIGSGIYLQTFDYQDGFLIYAAGLTRRAVLTRFKEHTRHYMNGEYNVLALHAARQGIRLEIWHGWGYARTHRDEFAERKIEIQSAIKKQLSGFRIFVARLSTEGRILERVEASVMNHLANQEPPYCTIPDQGMMLAPRWNDESPLLMVSKSSKKIHTLQKPIEI